MKIFAVLLVAVAVTADSKLVASILQITKSAKASEPLLVRYEVHNAGDADARLLKWGTPFYSYRGSLVGDPLQVTYVGSEQRDMTFTGILMKHAEPTEDDFIVIGAGQRAHIDVDVSHSYEMGTTGAYVVSPRSDVIVGQFAGVLVDVKPLEVFVTDGADALPEPVAASDWSAGWNETAARARDCGVFQQFINCNGGDLPSMQQAILRASQGVPALPVFNSDNPGDANSARWFGLSGLNLGAVRAGLQRSQDLMCAQGAFTIGARAQCDYGCSAYAYVYPTDPLFTVYLCSVFFRAPPTGLDSQMGTVLHEVAHFNPTSGTRDVQYGCSGCQQLAVSNPNGARTNSDSHEYTLEFSGFFPPVPNC